MYKFPGGLIGEIPAPANIWPETSLGKGNDLATLKGIKFQEYMHVRYMYIHVHVHVPPMASKPPYKEKLHVTT